MAFNINNLTLTSNRTGLTGVAEWKYVTEDAASTVDTSAYFNNASHQLRVGDAINVYTVDDEDGIPTAVTGHSRHLVVSNSAGVVDVSDTLFGALTDTD